MKAQYFKRIGTISAICCIPSFFLINLGRGMPLSAILDVVYGGATLTKDCIIAVILAFFLPMLLFVYGFSNYFCEDMRTRMPYVFTRTNKRAKWLIGKTTALFGYCSLTYAAHLVILVTLCFLCRVPMDFSGISARHLQMLLLNVAHIFSVSLFVNLLSLKLDPVKVVICTIMAHVGMFFLFLFAFFEAAPALIFAFPVCQFVYFWHELPSVTAAVISVASGFTVVYSFVYFLALISAVLGIALWAVRKMDIL